MEKKKAWDDFAASGSVSDYIKYVDSCKQQDNSKGAGDALYYRGVGNTGKQCGGE